MANEVITIWPPPTWTKNYVYRTCCLEWPNYCPRRPTVHAGNRKSQEHFFENLYSPNKHGRRINNTNTIKTTQLESRQKHLKLDSNLDTRLTHNTLGKAKPKYS